MKSRIFNEEQVVDWLSPIKKRSLCSFHFSVLAKEPRGIKFNIISRESCGKLVTNRKRYHSHDPFYMVLHWSYVGENLRRCNLIVHHIRKGGRWILTQIVIAVGSISTTNVYVSYSRKLSRRIGMSNMDKFVLGGALVFFFSQARRRVGIYRRKIGSGVPLIHHLSPPPNCPICHSRMFSFHSLFSFLQYITDAVLPDEPQTLPTRQADLHAQYDQLWVSYDYSTFL